jgi:phospholipid-transporting ATPase
MQCLSWFFFGKFLKILYFLFFRSEEESHFFNYHASGKNCPNSWDQIATHLKSNREFFLFCRFIFYTAFSPQTALTDCNLVFYSLLYTSIPTIVTGILDKDLSHRTLLNYPQLYGSGQREEAYNQTLFWATMLDMLWQSLVIFYVPFFIYNVSDIDLYSLGCLWVIAVVVVVNVNLAMDILHWNWVTHVAVWGSVIATFLGQIIMDSLSFSDDLLSHYW